MANILYRSGTQGTTTFTPPSTNGSVARALTNAEIDGNFYSLDQAKFEIAGGTITGPTTFSSTVAINGNLTVAGTTTTINATNLAISDRNIELATGSTTAAGANGGGITLKGDGDKTITWDSTNANWTSSEHWNIATGKSFKINNVVVLNNTTLGSSIVNSSLTKLGTSAGFVKSDASGNLSSDTNTYLTGNQSITLSGDITGTGATAITATIANSAVTTAKIADINVTTAKIADANVTTVKLADGAATIAKGGVGFTTYAAGDIIYSNAVNSLAKLNKGSDGQVLKLVSGFPAWAADNDTVYSLPLAADGTRGGVQIGYSQNGKNYPVQLSGEKMYVNVPWTDTDTDTNTTYSIKASVQTGGAGLDLDAGGSGSGTDTVKILGSGATTVTQTDVNTITISSTAPGNGTLTTAAVAAGPTNTTVSLNLSGAYSANTTDNRTINPVVGPAITNLAAFMTNTPAGFIKRTGQDAYSIDTNTYLTSYTETDTLATVTARGASTSSNITLTGSTPITLTSASSNTITTGNGIPLTITTGSTGSSITIRPGQKTSGSGNDLTVAAGGVTATNAVGGTTTITGGISTATAGGSGGNIIIAGGYASGTSGTKNGGNVYIDGGGATSTGTNNAGNVYIGTNAGSEYFTNIIQIGHNASTIRLQGLGTSGFVKLGANGALSADTNSYSVTGHTHAASDITSGTFAFARLPTLYIGTTAIQSSSASQALTGITTLTTTGNISIYSDGVAKLFIMQGAQGTGNTLFQNSGSTNNGFAFTNANGTLLTVSSSGDTTAAGNVTAYSDARLKTNVKTLENSLEKTLKLRGVSYQKDGKDGVGVIAQEIREVLPEVVIEGDDQEKTLSVAYGNVVGLLIEAIKELNAKVEDLQKQLSNK